MAEYKKLRFEHHKSIQGGSGVIPLGVRMVLYPDLEFIPVDLGMSPGNFGQWRFKLGSTDNFVNLHVLNGWTTGNQMITQTIDQYVNSSSELPFDNVGGPDPSKDPLEYRPDFKPGNLLVYSNLDGEQPSVFYTDSAENAAYCSPLVVLDELDNMNYELLLPYVNTLRTLSYDQVTGKVKVEIGAGLNHSGDFLLPGERTNTLYWDTDLPYTPKGDSAIRLDLLPGIYTVGMILRVDSEGVTWPFAKRTFVFEVYEL